MIIVFDLIAENPLMSAPPFKAAMYIASSKALFLEVSIFSGSKIDLPVASTCLKLLKTSRDVAKFQKNELERI